MAGRCSGSITSRPDISSPWGTTVSRNYLDSGHNPIAGQWQHLAATYDGTTARFYIDGVMVASRTVSGGVGTSNIWRIGAYGSVAGGFFDGLIDNVRIYSRALSDAEVQTDMNTPVTMWNAGFPSVPTNLAVTAQAQTSVSAQWTASTDDVGVTGYNLYLDGTQVGTTTGTSYTFTGLSCSTSYQFGVEAVDGSANVSPRTLLTASTALCDVPVGLVAAYSFDEGSGGLVNDASGNGHLGTISGATWATGHFGGALSFNGTNASVDLGGLGTFYQSGFTLEAWVQKQTASKNDVAVLGSWTSSAAGPMIWVDHVATRYQLTLATTASPITSTPATIRSRASGNTSPPPSTARRHASTSTGCWSRAARCRSPSAARTRGGSARTARRRRASSTASSTTSASTITRSPSARSRRT